MREQKLKFEWIYDDYLAVTNQEDCLEAEALWEDVVNAIDNKHYESIDAEISETIVYVNDLITAKELVWEIGAKKEIITNYLKRGLDTHVRCCTPIKRKYIT